MPTSAWNTATAALTKHPVWIVRIDGYSGQFSTGPVKNPSLSTNFWLSAPSGLSQSVDPVTGRYTIGVVRFRLVDSVANVSILFATDNPAPLLATLRNRAVTILMGYADIDETDYQTVFRGSITECELGRDMASYEITCGTPQRNTVEELFLNADAGGGRVETTITTSASAGHHAVNAASTANILPDDYVFIGPNGSGDVERMRVAAVGNQDVVFTAALANAYPSGTALRWATTKIRGNPINIWYSLLTGTFSTGGSFPLVSYDGQPTGLGIDPANIDTAALIAERDDFLWGLEMSFEVRQRERAKDFFEKQIFRLFGLPVTTLDGKISFRAFRPARPSEVYTLTQADVRAVVEWKRAFESSYNRVVIRYSYDVERDSYRQEAVVEDTADQAESGVRELLIEQRGLFGSDSPLTEIYIDMHAKRLLRRFVRGAPTVKLFAHLRKRTFQIGDCIEFDHPSVPNIRAGRGVSYSGSPATTPKYQILAIDHRDAEAGLQLLLQEDGFIRPMWIAPSGQPDYGSATADQKRRWYISPTSGANFADATPPYGVM